MIQAGFMPVVALGFAVSPVAGQNFGARLAERVRATFRIGGGDGDGRDGGAVRSSAGFAPESAGAASSTRIRSVLAVGGEYLQIVAWNFVPSGIVFVSSSMFQALGNTIPSLVSSFIRTCAARRSRRILMSRTTGFALHWIWYLSRRGRRVPRDC